MSSSEPDDKTIHTMSIYNKAINIQFGSRLYHFINTISYSGWNNNAKRLVYVFVKIFSELHNELAKISRQVL